MSSPNTTCVTGAVTDSVAGMMGRVKYNGEYVTVFDLEERAQDIQDRAMQAKLSGAHKIAVSLYRELLPLVRVLEEVEAFELPPGMPTQLVLRAIELEEAQLDS